LRKSILIETNVMIRKVVVIGGINSAGISLLNDHSDIECEVITDVSEENLCRTVRGAHGLLVRTATITPRVIASAPKLEVVSRHGVGYDNVDVDSLTARGIPLALAIGSNAVSVAEHAMHLILALTKQGFLYHKAVQKGRFDFRQQPLSSNLQGKSILVIGFGRTGSRVAARAAAFDMDLYAIDPYIDSNTIRQAGGTAVTNLREILPQMDVVTIHCPRTLETHNLVGRAELDVMKTSAILINTARGGIVNETDLYEALYSGSIAGAGIDVFENEPPDLQHPLLSLSNIVLSPHCAGVTRESLVLMAQIAAQNVLDAFDGTLTAEMVANREVFR
jgi:D-3-phosphoglycerate dehydrogenase